MKRLTKADIEIFIKNTPVMLDRCVGKTVTANILSEMLQYKIIEQELGIDLITLFKAMENGFYFKDIKTSQIEFIMPRQALFGRLGFRYIFDTDFDYINNFYKAGMRYKDYGETWALTKKELENDK